MARGWFCREEEGSAPVVATKQGKVEGLHDKATGVYHFRGIPFAAPPVGALRFKKPQPHPAWEGVRRCKEYGRWAVQGLSLYFLLALPKVIAALAYGCLYVINRNPVSNTNPKRPQALPRPCSEADCLNLNVETTSTDRSKKMPVMVFIHGGGFYAGANSEFLYTPKHSPLPRTGIVLVTINYRLGALGFLKVEGGDYNCGLWDQVAALQWVQDNIEAFGGDPSNVTIFGESAGAMSCVVLSASRFAGKLFHRAIVQSGSTKMGITKEDMAWLAQNMAEALEVPSLSLETIGHIQPEVLLAAQNRVLNSKKCGALPMQPVIDGDLLPDRIVECWKQGSAKDLAIMMGHTKDEDVLFLQLSRPIYTCANEEDLLKKIKFSLGPTVLDVPNYAEAARRVLEEVKSWPEGLQAPSQADYWTYKAVDFNSYKKFSVPSHIAAQTLLGRCKSVYLFRFDTEAPAAKGAPHAVDLPYVFGTYAGLRGSLCPRDVEAAGATSRAVVRAWTNFAKTGDPNLGGAADQEDALPAWPALSAASPHACMVVDVPVSKSHVKAVNLREHFPALWQALTETPRALWFTRPSPATADGGKE